MKIKEGVAVVDVHPAARYALDVTDAVVRAVTGSHATITSLGEGSHSEGSYHYGIPGDIRCRAWDVRTRDMTPTETANVQGELRRRLGPDFDIVVEGSHIHGEYDPK